MATPDALSFPLSSVHMLRLDALEERPTAASNTNASETARVDAKPEGRDNQHRVEENVLGRDGAAHDPFSVVAASLYAAL